MNEHLNDSAIARVADGEDETPQHVRECAPCANRLLAAVELKRAVRDAIPRVELPNSLRHLGRPATRNSNFTWAFAAAAVIAIVIAGAGLESRRTAARELVDLHATIVGSASPIDVVSTDRHTVKPWFEGKLPFAVDVPELAGSQLHLVGGRVVFWRGEPGAYMLITKGAHRLSLFEFREDAAPSIGSVSSMTVQSWRANGLQYIAVGDVPASDLTALRPRPSR